MKVTEDEQIYTSQRNQQEVLNEKLKVFTAFQVHHFFEHVFLRFL